MDRKTFDNKINSLLENAEKIIPNEDVQIEISIWHTFEHELWKIGEVIRQLIHEEKKDLNVEQSDRICNICLNSKAKRGRQSFVMLLSKKRYFKYSDQLVSLLKDVDVSGHVLDALYKMKVLQYQEEVKPLLRSKYTWINKLAKRYIEKSQLN